MTKCVQKKKNKKKGNRGKDRIERSKKRAQGEKKRSKHKLQAGHRKCPKKELVGKHSTG
jgi:hypothetical protein